MKTNKIISIIFSIILIISLTSCSYNNLVSTEVNEVDAFVTDMYEGRFEYFVTVEYDGAKNQWNNEEVYKAYDNRLGATIKCHMIIRTYENGRVTKELVYNQELTN